jgi:hypothetical protein
MTTLQQKTPPEAERPAHNRMWWLKRQPAWATETIGPWNRDDVPEPWDVAFHRLVPNPGAPAWERVVVHLEDDGTGEGPSTDPDAIDVFIGDGLGDPLTAASAARISEALRLVTRQLGRAGVLNPGW